MKRLLQLTTALMLLLCWSGVYGQSAKSPGGGSKSLSEMTPEEKSALARSNQAEYRKLVEQTQKAAPSRQLSPTSSTPSTPVEVKTSGGKVPAAAAQAPADGVVQRDATPRVAEPAHASEEARQKVAKEAWLKEEAQKAEAQKAKEAAEKQAYMKKQEALSKPVLTVHEISRSEYNSLGAEKKAYVDSHAAEYKIIDNQ